MAKDEIVLRESVKRVLEKLPTPEAILVLEDWMDDLAKDNNNNNNNNVASALEDVVSRPTVISDAALKATLKKHGIIVE